MSSQISKTNETKHMKPVSTTNEPKLTLPSLSTKSSIGLKRQAHFDYVHVNHMLVCCHALPYPNPNSGGLATVVVGKTS